jgi:hypothetical protein
MRDMLLYAFMTIVFMFFYFQKKEEYQKEKTKIVLCEMIGSLLAFSAGIVIIIVSIVL